MERYNPTQYRVVYFLPAALRSLTWETVRRLIREGICRKPSSRDYLRLVAHFGPSADFDQEPDLLEEAWELLRVPTGAFFSAAHVTQEEAAKWKESRGRTWPQAFYYYAHHGRIDRGRLIDELIKALWGEFDSSERAGLIHFHKLLAPTEAELLARQSAYIELLRNPAATVVTFALTVLKSMAKSKAFDVDAAVKGLPAVFELPSKAQPKSALSLLKNFVADRPEVASPVMEAALRALAHPKSDVQLEAVRCLEAWRHNGLPGKRLIEVRNVVSPIVRPHLDRLCSGLEDVAAAPAGDDQAESVEPRLSAADLQARISRISPALKAVEAGRGTSGMGSRAFSAARRCRCVSDCADGT